MPRQTRNILAAILLITTISLAHAGEGALRKNFDPYGSPQVC